MGMLERKEWMAAAAIAAGRRGTLVPRRQAVNRRRANPSLRVRSRPRMGTTDMPWAAGAKALLAFFHPRGEVVRPLRGCSVTSM
jgi:hypothetical protein